MIGEHSHLVDNQAELEMLDTSKYHLGKQIGEEEWCTNQTVISPTNIFRR